MRFLRIGFGRAYSFAVGAAIFLLSAAVLAQTYSVEISAELGDLDVKVEPIAQEGILVINLTNNEQDRVRCDLVFDASPQFPHRTSVFVHAGRTVSSTLRETRMWHRVEVDVKCRLEPR